jgi:hypothetical protein
MVISNAGGTFQFVIWNVESQNILVVAESVISVHE